MSKKTLILGASPNPERYSYLATERLISHGHPVLPVGVRKGTIHGTDILIEKPVDTDIDTVTLYLNPTAQKDWYDYILGLHPKRIIFNPGTENPELEQLASTNKILTEQACTLVLLSTGAY